MLAGAFLLLAQAEAITNSATLPGSDGQIVLADAYRFGAGQPAAYGEYLRGMRHQYAMADEVRCWNDARGYSEWCRECALRIRAWSVLDDALRPGYVMWHEDGIDSVQSRLRRLYELRELIGREAFEAGVMPSPIPSYRR